MSGGGSGPDLSRGDDLSRGPDLSRIEEALRAAEKVLRPFTPGAVDFRRKEGRGDPLTEADRAVDRTLRDLLPGKGEGWLSEETRDDGSRLVRRRVWVVDPIDGTREFVEGIPEWCVSVALVEEGEPVAGGILNPATGEIFLGAVGGGVFLNGGRVSVRRPSGGVDASAGATDALPEAADPLTEAADSLPRSADLLAGATVLASRSEVGRGEWSRFDDAPFQVKPCGSVAYKMARVAAGLEEATWTLVPKSEWDVAAGAALVRAGGGTVVHADGTRPRFNRPDPVFPNLLAGSPEMVEAVLKLLGDENSG